MLHERFLAFVWLYRRLVAQLLGWFLARLLTTFWLLLVITEGFLLIILDNFLFGIYNSFLLGFLKGYCWVYKAAWLPGRFLAFTGLHFLLGFL